MNINIRGGGSLSPTAMLYQGLKSTQDKLERQQKRDDQIAFFEKQKENLKNMVCDSVEEMARKLDMFHSYEDQIKAAKAEYNNGQMFAVLDEARELGEKIAEEAEKMKPKTAEEIREERREEALEPDTDESAGTLEEVLSEIEEIAEELQEEALEEFQEELQIRELAKEALQEKAAQEAAEAAKEGLPEQAEAIPQTVVIREELLAEIERERKYTPIDILV